jgi:2-polyprenyl-6-hydroxyphenyl methylase/3-demethylubiquinone-9 3-methyltransferase
MINFTPEGLGATFFGTLAPYAPPPPPGAPSPLLWGSEAHVRALFGGRVAALETSRRAYVERAESPRHYLELFKETFGPAIAIYAGLAREPERMAALDRDFQEFVTRSNRGPDGGPAEYVYEYLLVIARKAGG